jgi:hypothetical protein
MGISRTKPAKHVLSNVEGIAKLKDQIYLGPGLRGLCALGVLGARKFAQAEKIQV